MLGLKDNHKISCEKEEKIFIIIIWGRTFVYWVSFMGTEILGPYVVPGMRSSLVAEKASTLSPMLSFWYYNVLHTHHSTQSKNYGETATR